jgi:hypothetical protein
MMANGLVCDQLGCKVAFSPAWKFLEALWGDSSGVSAKGVPKSFKIFTANQIPVGCLSVAAGILHPAEVKAATSKLEPPMRFIPCIFNLQWHVLYSANDNI